MEIRIGLINSDPQKLSWAKVGNWKFVFAIELPLLLRNPRDLAPLSLSPWGSVPYRRITVIPLPEIWNDTTPN